MLRTPRPTCLLRPRAEEQGIAVALKSMRNDKMNSTNLEPVGGRILVRENLERAEIVQCEFEYGQGTSPKIYYFYNCDVT